MRKGLLFKQLLLWAVIGSPLAALAQSVTVSDCHLSGWAKFTEPTGLLVFANGPATPPLHKGSVEFSLGANGNGKAALLYFGYAGTPLTAFTEMSYYTYVQYNVSGQAPALELAIDTTGDGVAEDRLIFEPVYQTGRYIGPAQNGGQVVFNTWQKWDALIGGWWASSDDLAGPPTYTLASYAASHPGATVALVSSFGSLVLTAGGGNTWNHFVGFADALTIDAKGHTTTFDFEACGEKSFDFTVCHNGSNISVSLFELIHHLKHGDELGPCGQTWWQWPEALTDSAAGIDLYKLSNFPNPFSQTTQIQYTLPYSGRVSVKVTDAAGRPIAVLVNADQKTGAYRVAFNGDQLTKGIYYYTIDVQSAKGFFTQTKAMTLLR